jgi:post-segregation antitoxin (ccd killing protein)
MPAERNSTSLSVDADLLERARTLNIDAVFIAKRAILQTIREKGSTAEKDELARIRKIDNAEAIASVNVHCEENGFPFAQYRRYRWRNMMCFGFPDSRSTSGRAEQTARSSGNTRDCATRAKDPAPQANTEATSRFYVKRPTVCVDATLYDASSRKRSS